MSFNRSGYIGRAPGDSAITISKQYFQPTGVTTDFTFSSGYDPGLIDVYRNGIKLINVLDYAATDGSTISLDTPVGVGSTVQVVAYKAFNLTTVKATELDTSVTGTDLTLSGDFTADTVTATTAFYVGTALTANAAGDVETIGIITASSFSGDGTGLSGVVGVGTLNVRTESLTVSGVSTFTGAVDSNATTDSTSSTTGAITAAGGVGVAKDLFVGDAIDVTKDLKVGAAATITGALSAGAISGSTGTFSGAVNVDDTTDSTSSTSGALIVDGGLGVAKNVYIGAGLSVAGTLTYEDVTSVDSVGLITAKSGVNITGGQLTVGSGITMGIAGVATFSGTSDVHLTDGVRLNIGDGSDHALYHDGTQTSFEGTVPLYIKGSNVIIYKGGTTDKMLQCNGDGASSLWYSASKKIETTNDGVNVTGIVTATSKVQINTPTTSVNENIPLLVKGILREEPAIGIEGPNANGYTWISDAYVDGEAQSSLGLSYSSSSFVIGQRVGVSTTTDNTYVSLTDAFAYRPSAIVLGHDGDIHFRNDNTNGVRPVGTAVTLTDRMVIKGDGDVGIGTDDPALKLHLHSESSNATFAHFTNTTTGVSASDGVSIGLDSDENVAIYNYESSAIRFATGGSEKARFDSSGRFLIGQTAGLSLYANGFLQVSATDGNAALAVNRWSDNSSSPYINLGKSRSGTVGTYTVVQDDDRLGQINFTGADGTDLASSAAEIAAFVDGTPGSNDMPGRLVFSTTGDGATAATERLRITSAATFDFTNGALIEKVAITAGKLSDNTNINLGDGMVHYFTTQESTTSTPNIRLNSSTTLNSVMGLGDVITVTLVTTAAAAGYSANMTIDGNAITEEWVGGSAPSAGGSDGLDIYVYTIICIHASNTGDSGFKVIANLTNATN